MMFYVDIDLKKFIAPPPGSDSSYCFVRPSFVFWGKPGCSTKTPYGPIAPRPCFPVAPVSRPVLTHTEIVDVPITLLKKGAPVDITDETLVLIVDNDFDHNNSLIAFCQDYTVVDAQNGVVIFHVNCGSQKFQKMLDAHIPPGEVIMQLDHYAPGSSVGQCWLQDRGIQLKPRVYTSEGQPPIPAPSYYTKSQIDAILKNFTPDDSDSTTGTVINGHGNPDDVIGHPGDMYINLDDHSIWLKGQTQWSFIGYVMSDTPELYYEIIEDL